MGQVTDAVVCTGLVKIYETGTARVQAVRGVDLRLAAGRAVVIAGPSGSGKSSLLRMISGLTTPTAGRVEIAGVDFSELSATRRRRATRRLVTHVEQHPADNLLPHLDARQQLQRIAHRRGEPLDAADVALERLGLGDRSTHLPHEMSGGEQQRLAFAKAAIGTSALVVADEPTAELDAVSAELVLDAIDALVANGTTALIATHDPRVIERVATTVQMRDGAVGSISDAAGTLAVIDGADRLQLPPDIRARFPDGTARLVWDDDGDVLRVERP